MSKNPTKLAEQFINEMSTDGSNAFVYLENLLEILENKIDPEPVEIYLIENIYHFIEKFRLLESNIKNYVNETKSRLPGNILTRLYENTEDDLFKDF